MLVFFYILAALAIVGATSVVLLRNPVYCALSLVSTFLCLAGIYILLNQEFVAAIQVLIYAGAIMVLFLFVIMLLNLKSDKPFKHQWTGPKMLGIGLALGILGQLVGVYQSPLMHIGPKGIYSPERLSQEGAVEIVGRVLFTDYVLPFEIISVLLLVAVIGAVIVAKRREPSSQEQGR
ncbi:MAG: NADH-quinone oxidoreductase subunit J [Deltaproteobacteria bacterium]|nr:NADH-quinone oxidoreductase subunit J [Deltaproteobacteria bacterium]